jgi:hypothetical protein
MVENPFLDEHALKYRKIDVRNRYTERKLNVAAERELARQEYQGCAPVEGSLKKDYRQMDAADFHSEIFWEEFTDPTIIDSSIGILASNLRAVNFPHDGSSDLRIAA